jgi:succinate-semialdehyde dehydrogenase/glutarate-semialdehyde dehydrogenase
MGMVDDAVSQGASIVSGGRIPPDRAKGYFYEPTVLENVTSGMRVFREEIFGPVAPLVRFHNEEAAIGAANDTEYGLVAYAYTGDLRRSRRLSERLEFGEVQINGFKYSIYLPHGGVKESGIGKDCSHLALDDYLVKKRVTIRL